MGTLEKNIKNKAVFTRNNGLLNDARKKYFAAADGFQFSSNRSTSIQTSKSEKKSTNKDIKRCTIVTNTFKYPNYLKTSSKLAGKQNLYTVKSTINHKIKVQPKNKSSNNDFLDSQSKILEMQTEKKQKDKANGNVCNGNKNAVSYRILSKYPSRYPNYLKASSKLKEGNYSCLTTSNSKVKSQLQNKGRKIVHGNAKLDIKNQNLELQTVIDENEKLKNKLTNIVESLQEIILQCKEDEEIDLLKYHTGSQKQEIKCQNYRLKFSQIDESNKMKKSATLKPPFKETNQRTNHQPLGYQMITLDDLDSSVFKSDLEKIKVLNPKQHLMELEKQNRLIIGNLNDLKEGLKRIQKLQTKKLEPSNTRKQQLSKTNRKETSNFSESLEPAVVPKQNISTVPLKKQPEMLREMIKFNKMVKEKESCFQDHKTMNPVTETQENDDSIKRISISNSLSKEVPKSKEDFCPILLSNSSKINCINDNIENFSETTNKNYSQEYLSQTTKLKKIHSHRLPQKLVKKSSHNVDENKAMVSEKRKEEEIQYTPSTAVQTDISQNKYSFKTKSNGRKLYPEHDSILTASINKDAKSCGDNAMALPKTLIL